MFGHYKGCRIFLEKNPSFLHVPCAAHSLNLIGRSAVGCCQEVVNFFSTVQWLYTLFQPQPAGKNLLKVVLEMKVS